MWVIKNNVSAIHFQWESSLEISNHSEDMGVLKQFPLIVSHQHQNWGSKAPKFEKLCDGLVTDLMIVCGSLCRYINCVLWFVSHVLTVRLELTLVS